MDEHAPDTTAHDIEEGGVGPEELLPPPDRPRGAEDNVTAREQREGDSLDERLERERRDASEPGARDEPGELLDQDPDREKDAVAEEGQERPDESAEEAAMRTTDDDDAPGLTDGPDRYTDKP